MKVGTLIYLLVTNQHKRKHLAYSSAYICRECKWLWNSWLYRGLEDRNIWFCSSAKMQLEWRKGHILCLRKTIPKRQFRYHIGHRPFSENQSFSIVFFFSFIFYWKLVFFLIVIWQNLEDREKFIFFNALGVSKCIIYVHCMIFVELYWWLYIYYLPIPR